ncbi:MAG: permease-like cell division protein FtsX [Clostridia bacterium]
MKWYNFTYFIREAFSSIFKHRLMSVAAVSVIAACLLIMGSFMLIAVNIESMLKEVEDQSQIVAYVNGTTTKQQEAALTEKIRGIKNVKNIEFITREQALKNFRVELGENSGLLDGMDTDNPLRGRFVVTMNDIRATEQTASELKAVSGIEEVSVRSDLSDKIIKVRSVVTAVCLILIIVLLAVAIFIISNTVNLTIFNRREEIAIMKMVGARNGFVRFPFIIEGLILGIAGALLALLVQWGLYTYVATTALGALEAFKLISFGDMVWQLLAVFIAVGAIVGSVGSALTMRKFLKV